VRAQCMRAQERSDEHARTRTNRTRGIISKGRRMTPITPGEIELFTHYRRHLGPRFDRAGLRLRSHYNQQPGIQFHVPVSSAYRAAIIRGIEQGMAKRFPDFPTTGSIWVHEIVEDDVESSEHAFYTVARAAIEQAYTIASVGR